MKKSSIFSIYLAIFVTVTALGYFLDGYLGLDLKIFFGAALVIHDIKVLEGNQGFFVAMPSRKTPDGQYKDVAHPLNTPTREELNKAVLAEFEKAKSAPQE